MHRKYLSLPVVALLISLAALLVHAADPAPRTACAPVLSMREFELKPGVDPADFEKFLHNDLAAAVRGLQGLKIEVLRGDRGERKNRYILVWQFESVALRDRFFPTEGGWGISPAFDGVWKQLKPVMEKFNRYARIDGGYTDYVTIAD